MKIVGHEIGSYRSDGSRIIHGYSAFEGIPRLGLPYLLAVLRQEGYGDLVIRCDGLIKTEVQDIAGADIYLVSFLTPNKNRAIKFVSEIKKLKNRPLTIAGGYGATFAIEELVKHFDLVFAGEAEMQIGSILEAVRGKFDTEKLQEIPGVNFKTSKGIFINPTQPIVPQEEMDALPFPALDLVLDPGKKMRIFPLSTSRGCPFNCNFCQVILLAGRRCRFHSPEYVLQYIKWLIDHFNPSELFFVDDNFFIRKERTQRILSGMIERKLTLPWLCQMRAESLLFPKTKEVDHATLSLMQKSGCIAVLIGVESLKQQTLDEMGKNLRLEESLKALPVLSQYRINLGAMMVYGWDTETEKDIEAMVPMLKKQLKAPAAIFSVRSPLPGTRDTKELQRQGRIFPFVSSDDINSTQVVFQPQNLSAYRLQLELVEIYKKFYSWKDIVRSFFSGLGQFFSFKMHYNYTDWHKRKIQEASGSIGRLLTHLRFRKEAAWANFYIKYVVGRKTVNKWKDKYIQNYLKKLKKLEEISSIEK